ncbi:MAG: type II secretion system F family protein [bacterium]
MPKFKWEGRNRQGQSVRGEIEAANPAVAVLQLRKQQILPMQVKPEKAEGRRLKLRFTRGVKEKEVAIFTRQLATMIDAGLPLVQSLEILASQQDNPAFKEILLRVKGDVEAGATFSDSLQKQPKVFNELYTNLVTAGEIGGTLDIILNRLSQYMEKAIALKKRVKGAMVYPSAILGVSVLVVIVLLVFVIPVFEKMFAGFGAALPAPTQFIIALSNFVKSNLLFVVAGLVAFVALFRRYYRTPGGRSVVDRSILKAPVFGALLLKIAVARFTRTLGTLISSGVPILDGLHITSKTAGNKVVEEAILKTRVSISEGKTIAEPLGEASVFPPMVVQMIGVGESTGSLDAMLNKIADFYDEEVNATVAALTSLLEPIMMVFLGVLIGGMMVAMYLPIFKMASVIS